VFSLNETFSRCRRPIIRMAGEAAGCVEHTERVQLQWHCEGVDENSAALACEGVDENARAWTKTRGNPDSCIGACQQRIDAVCRAGSTSAVPSAQPPKSECEHAAWLLVSKTRSLQTFLTITLASRAAPSKLLIVWIVQSVCRASAGCVDCTAGRASVWIATIFACHCSCTRSVSSTQPAASHHSPRVGN